MLRHVSRSASLAAKRSSSALAGVRQQHTLPPLPYPAEAGIGACVSARTLEFHYGKHHQTYVNNANKLLAGSTLEGKDLVEVIRETSRDANKAVVFNNTAQIYNHTFFWESMTPQGSQPSGELLEKLNESWGDVDKFKEEFLANATGVFGSGWTWLCKEDATGRLLIKNTSNAHTPIEEAGITPLLTCDVWEHSYYLDFQNRRPDYVKAWFDVIDWDRAASRYAQ